MTDPSARRPVKDLLEENVIGPRRRWSVRVEPLDEHVFPNELNEVCHAEPKDNHWRMELDGG